MMKFCHFVLLSFAFLFLSGPVRAEEDHSLTDIIGNHIQLKSFDHAIAGSIKGFVIFGNKDERTGQSELIMKKDGQVIRATFGKLARGGLGGVITHQNQGQTVATNIQLAAVDTQNQTLTFRFNDQVIPVHVTGDDFRNNHFINPQYHAVINGENVDFKMVNGQACYGFSAHLIMMILGSYLH